MIKKILSTLLTSSVLFAMLATTAYAGFTVRPAFSDKWQLDYKINAGDSLGDSLLVRNNGEEPVLLNLYGADGTQSVQGAFTITNKDDEQFTVGKWITISNPEFTLDGLKEIEVPFSIDIPASVPPGTYVGGIATQTLASEAPEGGGPGFGIISRFATKMFIDIPGEKIHEPKWTDFSHIDGPNNSHQFNLSFVNEGTTLTVIETEVEIFGWPYGNEPNFDPATISDLDIREKKIDEMNENIIKFSETDLFQKDTIDLSAHWGKRPLYGKYTAVATTTLSEYDVRSGKKINPETIVKEVTFFVIWWQVIALIIAFVVLVIGLIVYKSFHMSNLRKKCNEYTIKPTDTLVSIAKEDELNWKTLAKINKIKAPYSLEGRKTILVPPKK